MKNIKDLRLKLTDIFKDYEDGVIGTNEVREFANLSGKIISSAKVEIDYAKLNKTKKKIDFLEY